MLGAQTRVPVRHAVAAALQQLAIGTLDHGLMFAVAGRICARVALAERIRPAVLIVRARRVRLEASVRSGRPFGDHDLAWTTCGEDRDEHERGSHGATSAGSVCPQGAKRTPSTIPGRTGHEVSRGDEVGPTRAT